MVQTGLRWAAWAALALVAWVLSASVIFLWLGGLLEARGIAPWQRPFAWLVYAPYAGRDLFETAYLAVSAVVFPAFALALVVRYRATVGPSLMRAGGRHLVRGTSDNHGHADWMPLAQARALFPGPQPPYGGVVVGEAYRVDQDAVAGARFDPEDRRSWGRGGAAPLLIDPCTTGPTHSLVFAGSGGFKTTSAISTLLHWTGSAVVLDPACEIGPMTARSRAEIGHRVHHLTLDDPACGLDVLDWIDISTPMAETHVRSVVWWLAGGESAGRGRQDESATFFKARGHALIACLLAHMLWDERLASDLKTLRTLRAGLAKPEPEMRLMLQAIHRDSASAMARDYAGALMGLVDETFSGVYANADEDSSWLANPAFAALVSGSRFRTADILRGKTTIYLQIPLMALAHSPSVARVVVGALLNTVYEADGQMSGGAAGSGRAAGPGPAGRAGRVLFLLDEAARLGTMRMIEDARDLGRKYGITLQLLYQSEAQLARQWGPDGRRAWFDGVSWRGYAALQDPETARELCSSVFGNYAVLATSEGTHRGTSGRGLATGSRSRGGNRSVHEIKRELIRPDELLGDVRADELFVIPRGARPIRCGRAIFFRRPELVERVDGNRFHRKPAA